MLDYHAEDPEKFLHYLYKSGTGPNGVCGCDVFWQGRYGFLEYIELLESMANCEGRKGIEAWEKIFPGLRFIHLIRKNKLRQAISNVKAQQTNVFSQWRGLEFNENEREPVFDYEEIKNWLNILEKSEDLWNRFFLDNGIEPLKVYYEVLTDKFEDTALAVLDFLGIDYPHNLQFAPRYLLRQSDHINDEWEERFLALQAASLE